jgi:hypothetical protein
MEVSLENELAILPGLDVGNKNEKCPQFTLRAFLERWQRER